MFQDAAGTLGDAVTADCSAAALGDVSAAAFFPVSWPTVGASTNL